MKIKQIVVLTGQTEVADSILSGLEQLGLQICIRDHFSFEDNDNGKDCLIVCDPGYVETPNGSWSLRQALGNGCNVLLDGTQGSAVMEEIKETGGLSSKTKNDLEAFARSRPINLSDPRDVEELRGQFSCGCLNAQSAIEALIRYRRRSEKLVYRRAESALPTNYGRGRVVIYGVKYESQEPLAVVIGVAMTRKTPSQIRLCSTAGQNGG